MSLQFNKSESDQAYLLLAESRKEQFLSEYVVPAGEVNSEEVTAASVYRYNQMQADVFESQPFGGWSDSLHSPRPSLKSQKPNLNPTLQPFHPSSNFRPPVSFPPFNPSVPLTPAVPNPG
jgi:hypothetical protein